MLSLRVLSQYPLPPPQQLQTLRGMMQRSSLMTVPRPRVRAVTKRATLTAFCQTPSCFGTLARGHLRIYLTKQ